MKFFLNERMLLNGDEWIPAEETFVNQTLINLLKAIGTINFLPDVDLYYSEQGLATLVTNITDLVGSTEYAIGTPIARIRQALYDIGASSWEGESMQNNSYSYYLQIDKGSGQPLNVNGSTIAECSERKINREHLAIVSLDSSEYNTESLIHINRSKNYGDSEMNIISVDNLFTPKLIIEYLIRTREKRNFHVIKKHGENGVGALPNNKGIVSVLECSQEEAQALLDKAVGTRDCNELYAYDDARSKFIVFKYEGDNPQNKYHGYHPENQNDIPEKVQVFWRTEYNNFLK